MSRLRDPSRGKGRMEGTARAQVGDAGDWEWPEAFWRQSLLKDPGLDVACESRTSQQRHLDFGQEPLGGERCQCLRTDLGGEQGVAVGKAAHMGGTQIRRARWGGENRQRGEEGPSLEGGDEEVERNQEIWAP